MIESKDAIFLESTNQITPLEEIRLQEYLDNENQDQYMDASKSGRKRKLDILIPNQQAFVPNQQAFNSKKSGSKRIRWPSTMLKDYHLFNIEENLNEEPTNYGKTMARCYDG